MAEKLLDSETAKSTSVIHFERYTLKKLLKEYYDSVFDLDGKSILNTFIALLLNPGKAIKANIDGKSRILYPSLKYLLIAGATIAILTLRYGFFHNEFTTTDTGVFFIDNNKDFFSSFFKFAEEYGTWLNFNAIPVFAWYSWLIFDNKKYNFAENFILNTYIAAPQLLFLIVLIPFIEINLAWRDVLIPIYIGVTYLYNVWVYMSFFEGSKIMLFVKPLVTLILAYALQFPVNLSIYYLFNKVIAPSLSSFVAH